MTAQAGCIGDGRVRHVGVGRHMADRAVKGVVRNRCRSRYKEAVIMGMTGGTVIAVVGGGQVLLLPPITRLCANSVRLAQFGRVADRRIAVFDHSIRHRGQDVQNPKELS